MPRWLARWLWRVFGIGRRVKIPGRPVFCLVRKPAMQLINMKMDAEEAEEETGLLAAQVANQAPAYPYGLTLSLCDESLQKLGVTTPPAVGSTVMIMARATVTSMSSEQMQNGEAEQRLGLQITDMAPLGADGAPKTDAQTMYG